MILSEFAPAKVNLFLHVGPPGADGFHPLSSLMVFADIGDRLSCEPSARFTLELDGPMQGDAPPGDDNLVARAARAIAARGGTGEPGVRLLLSKHLPAGAGLGGGSSDAAATLRLLRRALSLPILDQEMLELGAALGSDVPACIAGAPVLAQGRGERLSPAPRLPELPAVLVRPPVGSSTPAVYRAYDLEAVGPSAAPPPMPASLASAAETAAFLGSTRNDLEAPAVTLQPLIGEALELLGRQPEALLVRMSGSGSACFALCGDAADAARLARRLAAGHPGWWVQDCRLGGTPDAGS